MFPDLTDEEDVIALVTWQIPGYARSMAGTKRSSTGKSAAGNTVKKRATTKAGSTRKKAK